jgi:hypothetical protein
VGSHLMAARPDVSSTDLDSSHDAALPRSVTGGVLTDSGLMAGAQTVEIRFSNVKSWNVGEGGSASCHVDEATHACKTFPRTTTGY